MRTIYKYKLDTTDLQTVQMPEDARILCVQTQQGEPCLWAMVNPERKRVDRQIATYGTGHPIPVDISAGYIGTYQLSGGMLVFHVFDV